MDKTKVQQKPFAIKIKALRKDQKLTMKALGSLLGVSDTFVAMLEKGKRQPNRQMVYRLVNAFYPKGNEALLDELLLLAGFSPSSPESYFKPEDPIVKFEKMWQESRDFHVFIGLIRALFKAGRHKEAKEQLDLGFKEYQDTYQLYTLIAQLELLKGNYQGAITSQQNAIDQSDDDKDIDPLNLSLLFSNLGIFYFEKGYSHLEKFENALTNQKERKQALKDFKMASQYLETSLSHAKDNIYALDELARVKFNIAYLSKGDNTKQLWKETVLCFENILLSSLSHQLDQESLQETCAFLAHAYTKSERFDDAEKALVMMSAFRPQSWLLYYLKACLYNAKYKVLKNRRELDFSLQALQQAIKSPEKNNHATSQAINDPDLLELRQECQQDFEALLKGSNN